ncbi:two-component sensor histidine kinase [Arcticibacterium luteifluviistationis]|uniref:histidine kinase n=1 Tax=Arcticibacterium luteifluviistationis TaxID=1784714 RepID=A0A2Z4GIH3_9BACT|nr:two-component sensor histidine kinase [Arcticibacterium luteifluviistationis]
MANKELNQSQKLLQLSLKEASEYKDALDETTIIAITDQKGIIKKVNSNFCKISKYTEEELIGQDHKILNSGYHSKAFIHDLWKTIAKGKTWKGEFKNKAKDGTFYWVDTTIVPFLNKENKPYQYLAIRVDITQRKASEEDLKSANIDLVFQNEEKEKRAAELGIANKKLAFENEEKEKRAAELGVANKELAFENEEKGKRAAELIVANKELVFQNEEKEKRAAELTSANKELESFTYISSHDLQEPLRKIQIFASRLLSDESQNLSDKGKRHVTGMHDAANRMQVLITDLLAYSRTTTLERKFESTDLNTIIASVLSDFSETIAEKNAIVHVGHMCHALIIPFQFRQLMHNVIGNALKFSQADLPPLISIESSILKGNKVENQNLLPDKDYCHITITDNGIGFEPRYKDHIFELFKRLHDKEKISGTGIGLTIVKKIVENHHGIITATSELNKGATFDIYIPAS